MQNSAYVGCTICKEIIIKENKYSTGISLQTTAVSKLTPPYWAFICNLRFPVFSWNEKSPTYVIHQFLHKSTIYGYSDHWNKLNCWMTTRVVHTKAKLTSYSFNFCECERDVELCVSQHPPCFQNLHINTLLRLCNMLTFITWE